MSNAVSTPPTNIPPTSYVRARGGSDGRREDFTSPRAASSIRPSTSYGGMGTSTSMGSLTMTAASQNAPGSFSTSLRNAATSSNGPHSVTEGPTSPMSPTTSEQLAEALTDKLNKAIKIKEGAENLLQVLDTTKAKEAKKARNDAEREYYARNQEITQLKNQLEAIKKSNDQDLATRPARQRGDETEPLVSGEPFVDDPSSLGTESPTFSLTEILRDLEEKGNYAEYYVEKANCLVLLLRRHPNLKYELNWETFGQRLHELLLHDAKEVTAAGYRVARYAMTDLQSLRSARALYTDNLVIISLAKDSRSNVEREQALKFVRAFTEVKEGVSEISRGVIRGIVACAELGEDRLKGIAIETLAEILVLEPSLVVSAGGIRILTQVLAEGPYELSESLGLAFMYLLDMPETRKFVRPGHDLEVVFSAFTSLCSSKAPIQEDTLKSTAKVISSMLKSWPGLLCLSMFDRRTLRSFVESLRIPSTAVREVILDLFFDLFRIKPPSWSSTFLAGRRLTTYGRVANLKSETTPRANKKTDEDRGNLVDHFTSLLLAVFFDVGLVRGLTVLVEDNSDPAIVRKTTLLLGEILKLASQLLPKDYHSGHQLLPTLFASATNFGVERDRFPASGAVYLIDSLNRTLYRSIPTQTLRNPTEDEKRGQRQVEQVKMKLNMTIDDRHFSNLIVDTGVLNTKTYSKWNWDILNEIIQGPLLNPKRLEEAIKVTKFMKRLVSFYRPFKYKFSEIRNTKPNQRYIKTGCALFNTLLQTIEGVRYLNENKLLRQIAECLAQLDRMSGIGSSEPLFSTARLSDTLCSGYFAMLGVLSCDPKGLAMMERLRMFNMFYHISDLRDRPDLLKIFVTSMDFTLDGHPRIILSKALTTSPKSVRLFATNHLRRLISTTPTNQETVSMKSTETAEWAIRLLVIQLYDPDVEVCGVAVKILEEACNCLQNLEYVVKCRPALDHLGEIGAPLLLRFLSTSVGYHYLNELDYINREMDDWFHGRNDSYVLTVEASLARAFAEDDNLRRRTDFNITDKDALGIVPPHFYRELARTREGCVLLKEKGHFNEFALFVREHGLDDRSPEIVTKVKGCLWALGNIGSMPFGNPFLDETDIVGPIVRIAELSNVLTLKGTAFFVLGLISRTMPGLEVLLEHGWDSTVSTMGECLGFSVPMNLERFLSIQPWRHAVDETNVTNRPSALSVLYDDDTVEGKILESIANLSNHIKESTATKELLRYKSSQAANFLSSDLYCRAMLLLESYHYRPAVRRFILDLFGKSAVECLIFGKPRSEPDQALSTLITG